MSHSENRRNFLAKSIKAGAAVTLANALSSLSACSSAELPRPDVNLVKDPNGICDLPADFSYTVISKHGETMSDGHTVPDKHDGMACFEGPKGQLILVRNHEIALYLFSDPESPVPELAYDTKSSGDCIK